jgi:hypothetical protein
MSCCLRGRVGTDHPKPIQLIKKMLPKALTNLWNSLPGRGEWSVAAAGVLPQHGCQRMLARPMTHAKGDRRKGVQVQHVACMHLHLQRRWPLLEEAWERCPGGCHGSRTGISASQEAR